LTDGQGRVLLRAARVYGFRNIQTLMRQMKTKRCTYHYVEVIEVHCHVLVLQQLKQATRVLQ
jgi:hypothetical protein